MAKRQTQDEISSDWSRKKMHVIFSFYKLPLSVNDSVPLTEQTAFPCA